MQTQTIIQPEFTTIDGHRIRYAASRREGYPQLLLTSPQPQSILAYEQWWERLTQQFDLIEGAGHYSYEDNAEQYLAHVLRWIARAEAS